MRPIWAIVANTNGVDVHPRTKTGETRVARRALQQKRCTCSNQLLSPSARAVIPAEDNSLRLAGWMDGCASRPVINALR